MPLLDEVEAGTRHVDDTFGVVRKSPLLLLDNFDIVYGCPLDYMHCVLLGVVRQVTRILWNDTSLSDCYLNRDGKLPTFSVSCVCLEDQFSLQPKRSSSKGGQGLRSAEGQTVV